MEVFLYNSTVCRLCGEENDNGTLLYSNNENIQNLSEIINTHLPLKVSDDGELPRTICPGCTIQLEATVEFLNLIINGQKIIRELLQREREYKKNILNTSSDTPDVQSENIIYEINTSDGVYHVEHPISLQVAGLDKPKRKRGRPPKKHKTPEEIAKEEAAKEQQPEVSKPDEKDEEEPSGKRKRKAPTRFREAVQGKELERIFIEVGVIDGEEEKKSKADAVPKEPEVIGHLEDSGELIVVVKGKGRGRPKGRTRQTVEECAMCGQQFSSRGRYMSHVASHGRARFRCDCGATFVTRAALAAHHELAGHSGERAERGDTVDDADKSLDTAPPEFEMVTIPENNNTTPTDKKDANVETSEDPQALPDLSDATESKIETVDIVEEVVDVVDDNDNGNNEKIVVSDSASEDANDEVQTDKGKKLKCNHCDKLFSNRQSKSLHVKAVHLGVKSYACTECEARFAYPQSLAVHRVSHRRFRPTSGYACDLCGKVLNHPSSVVYHKQAEHAAQRYVCGACGKPFRHKQLLQRHQLVHSQARPFTCKTCNATFKTKANLLNHQLLHSGIKKFSCDICKQKFAHKTSLTLHMRWHTGLKPFSCDVCGKSFSQKGNLSEHSRIHTGEKPYQCALCPRRFTTSSQHRLHARRHARRPAHDRIAAMRREDINIRRRRMLARRNIQQTQKQISLLVNDKNQHAAQIQLQQMQVQQVQMQQVQIQHPVVEKLELDDADTEERVIYVAYEADDSDATAFHILDPEQEDIEENKALSTCELYSGASLLVPQLQPADGDGEEEEEPLQEDDLQEQLVLKSENIAVTDEQGNPLHFTMQDGTKLAITSIDGETLQVITQDGQTIPVEINGFNEEEEAASADAAQQADVTHYYTIV
ncbi:unnamed protein product [Euphydryas editha]|uniref:Uncharacterized protein n=1 Tax=Euphydryas editha TaxID=104508 RepID=A0AAU9UYT3_EUPED|nr:unnamed protein product [Euphydryas editha]